MESPFVSRVIDDSPPVVLGDLDLVMPTLPTKIVTATVEGILELSDIQQLLSGETSEEVATAKAAEDPTNLKRIREKHHSVARLIANGMTQRLVASISGYTESYLSVLLNNPAMQELVDHYRTLSGQSAQVIGEKLRTVGMKALERLDDKIDSDELNNGELLAAAKLGLDRSGHGPSATRHIVDEHHVFDHAKIAEMNARARADSRELITPISEARRNATLIEHQPSENQDGD